MRLRTTISRIATGGAVLLLAAAFGASAQNNQDQMPPAGSSSGMESQPGGAPSSDTGMSHQGGNDSTLEISPQTGVRPPSPSSNEIPSNREFRPGEDTASVNREFKPGEFGNNRGGNGQSCLGLTLKYTNYCFKGAEEHGLEVTSIDRNSPAEQAGLKATGDKGGMLAAAETASALLGPLQLLTNHFVEKAAQADRGDLIVAVDDQRVRSEADFNDAMAKARPGDTMYLTVIRPMPDGDHRTMKIAVTVGKWQPGSADTCSATTTASAQPTAPQ